MTRLTVVSLSFIFCLILFIFSTVSQAAVIKNDVIFLSIDWHSSNSVLSWENISLNFNGSTPVGRLALAKLSSDDVQGLAGEILQDVYKWQFMDKQPIELIEVTLVVSNPERKQLAVYLNTDGRWLRTSSVQLGPEQIQFHIQSPEGMIAVVGLEKEVAEEYYELVVDAATVVRGYTFDTPDKNIRIGFMPDLVNKPFTAKVRVLNNFSGAQYLPDNLNFASDIYHIWLDSDEPLDLQKPIPVQIKFLTGNDEFKNIYYYDPKRHTWNLSPSTTLYDLNQVRTLTYNQEYILAVVADPLIKERGQASWFSSSITPRNPWGAANNDYPIGTVVRVTNLANNKYYDTEIISRGPYVDFRIIDLTSNAFKQIASLSQGVINVKVEPVDMIIK